MLQRGDEEHSFSSEFELSTKGGEKLQINACDSIGSFRNLQICHQDNCLVKVECWARPNTEDQANVFADRIDLRFVETLRIR